MEKEEELLKSLIAGEAVGAALGALIANDKSEGEGLGAIAGAALFAGYRASLRAQMGSTPVLILKNGNLYEVCRGVWRFVRTIKLRKSNLPKKFDLY
jgi:hypothetical protein